MMFTLIGWHPGAYSIYGLFPNEQLAELVATRLTPAESLFDGNVLWRHEHDTAYSGAIAQRFILVGKDIVSWSIVQDRMSVTA